MKIINRKTKEPKKPPLPTRLRWETYGEATEYLYYHEETIKFFVDYYNLNLNLDLYYYYYYLLEIGNYFYQQFLKKSFKKMRKFQFIEFSFQLISYFEENLNQCFSFIDDNYSIMEQSMVNCRQEFNKLFLSMKKDKMVLIASFFNPKYKHRGDVSDYTKIHDLFYVINIDNNII